MKCEGALMMPTNHYWFAALLGIVLAQVTSCDDTQEKSPDPCGNGRLEVIEDCDDGNTADGDGCDGGCTVETGWTCAGDPSVCVEEFVPRVFSNPERVIIQGWEDHAMEPFLSPDGMTLFFNNSNDASVNTNLHSASRIDGLTFAYDGEVGGVNSEFLDGVASLAIDGTFVFVSTRTYDTSSSTLYWGLMTDGTVTGVELIPELSIQVPGIVNFDAEIHPDGKILTYVHSLFNSEGPQTADLRFAVRTETGFSHDPAGEALLSAVNTDALEYAPVLSPDELELFFTRYDGVSPEIFLAVRESVTDPFSEAVKVEALVGFVEAPTLSADGKSLYYHKLEAGRFVLYRVTR
ncbi:hypothetical protein KKD52_03605 [Myxococcota bacterium]|nr:hypothetical protein [Myxococcota bacterium]